MAERFLPTHEPHLPCPACRGDRFLWGVVRINGGVGRRPTFFADDPSFLGGLAG